MQPQDLNDMWFGLVESKAISETTMIICTAVRKATKT